MWKLGSRECKSVADNDITALCIPEIKWEKLDNGRAVCTVRFIVVYTEWGKEAANELFFILPSSSALWLVTELKTRPNLRLLLPRGVLVYFGLRMFRLLDCVCVCVCVSSNFTHIWRAANATIGCGVKLFVGEKLQYLFTFRLWSGFCCFAHSCILIKLLVNTSWSRKLFAFVCFSEGHLFPGVEIWLFQITD